MKTYKVLLSFEAQVDIEEIYEYMLMELGNSISANEFLINMEHLIETLETFPNREFVRKNGRFKGLGYRQLMLKNYTVVYEVIHSQQIVVIHTIFYAMKNV